MSNVQIELLKDQQRVESYRDWLFRLFLAWVLVLSVAMVGGLLRWQQINDEDGSARSAAGMARTWDGAIAMVTGKLDATARLIAASESVTAAFTAGKRERLLSAVAPWFQTLRASRHLSSLTFIGPDHRLVLVAGEPARPAEVLETQPLQDAEKTRNSITALQVTRSGAALVQVSPLVQGGRLLGFLELGLDMEIVAKTLAEAHKAETLVLLRKDLPAFAQKDLPHPPGWDRFADVFVAAESRPGLADVLEVGPAGDTIKSKNRFQAIPLALTDGSGQPIGRIDVVVADAGRQRQGFILLAIFAALVLGVSGLAIGAVYLVLFRFHPSLHLSEQERRNLEQVSQRDGLTGLYNRDAFDVQLHKEVSHAHKLDLPLSVMLVNLEPSGEGSLNNDTDLHDAVLLNITATLQRQLRLGDVAARYTDRRFALIIQGVGGLVARDVAERLRRALSATRTEAPSGLITLSATVGVACYPDHAASPVQLFHEAERALTAARSQGGSHVVIGGPDLGGTNGL